MTSRTCNATGHNHPCVGCARRAGPCAYSDAGYYIGDLAWKDDERKRINAEAEAWRALHPSCVNRPVSWFPRKI